MLIFHEGLPGSGKSYEAVVRWLVPAVQKGRRVCAFINGINHDRISEVAGVDVERVRELVTQLTEEQLKTIWGHVPDNALILLDEMQDYWPSDRQKPPKDLSQFVTQHRHRGLDIIGMGQALKDVHPLWRRRVDRKIQFETRDVIGKPQDYTWRAFKLRDPARERWEQVQTGKGTYEEKFFGMYKSTVSEDVQTERLADDRIVVWNTKAIRFGLPALAIVMAIGIMYLWSFFTGGAGIGASAAAKKQDPAPQVQTVPARGVQSGMVTVSAAAAPVVETRQVILDPFHAAMASGRPRLSGVMRLRDKVEGIVEVYDSDQHLLERWQLSHAMYMGWAVTVHPWGVVALKGDVVLNLITWPIDSYKGGQDSTRGPLPSPTQEAMPTDHVRGRLISDSGSYGGIPPVR